ncbi:MAG: B3/4 domain-containing protein [Bacillota bacterium]|nr:B3/4 domain-containing protein [Bacillota bacterium]
MKKFIMEADFLEIFPEAQIGILVCRGIDNHIKEEGKYEPWLRECEEISKKYTENPELTANPVIRGWRDAFYKFKTKKGARCSIEALLKRVAKGNQIGSIIPLVDIYNGISLKYGVPIGGENIDKFEGNVRLTLAEGGEDFVTYGSEGKSEPPSEGEVVYKDDFGAICRCWNWREAERTMLTEDTVNAFMIIEAHNEESAENMEAALEELKSIIEKDLGGRVSKHLATATDPEVTIEE